MRNARQSNTDRRGYRRCLYLAMLAAAVGACSPQEGRGFAAAGSLDTLDGLIDECSTGSKEFAGLAKEFRALGDPQVTTADMVVVDYCNGAIDVGDLMALRDRQPCQGFSGAHLCDKLAHILRERIAGCSHSAGRFAENDERRRRGLSGQIQDEPRNTTKLCNEYSEGGETWYDTWDITTATIAFLGCGTDFQCGAEAAPFSVIASGWIASLDESDRGQFLVLRDVTSLVGQEVDATLRVGAINGEDLAGTFATGGRIVAVVSCEGSDCVFVRPSCHSPWRKELEAQLMDSAAGSSEIADRLKHCLADGTEALPHLPHVVWEEQ
jgi:hypothetical protein